MCWNADVSLNTFLFSSFVLLLILYNNTFTNYKVPTFKTPYYYLFFVAFILMQLVEYGIWKNISNNYWNHILSWCALIVLAIQPVASIYLIQSNKSLRNKLVKIYGIIAIIYLTFISIQKESPYVSLCKTSGNLVWNFTPLPNSISYFKFIPTLIWSFFFFFSFVYEKIWVGLIFGLMTYMISIYLFVRDGSFGSVWCWFVNSIMFYYAAYLIFYKPGVEFFKKSKGCLSI
jgi:hypothetical protein